MGVSSWLAARAGTRAHVLLVGAPGSFALEVATERAVRERGWRLAAAPADADLLVVCGAVPDRLGKAIEVVWDQLPGPRARAEITVLGDLDRLLDEAVTVLRDGPTQDRDSRERPPSMAAEHADHDMPEEPEHEPMDHGDMDHSGMDHSDMDMAGPGGIALAAGAPDRDGLEMDVLHVALGPVLPSWPSGLVLRCTFQGDVVTEATPELLPATPAAGGVEHGPGALAEAALAVHWAAEVVSLAGWPRVATRLRRLRDDVLSVGYTPAVRAESHRLHRWLGRSALLRWSLRDVGLIEDAAVRSGGLPGSAAGDVHARLLGLLPWSVEVATGRAPCADPDRLAAALSKAVVGGDLAATRLVVASLAGIGLAAPAAVAARSGTTRA